MIFKSSAFKQLKTQRANKRKHSMFLFLLNKMEKICEMKCSSEAVPSRKLLHLWFTVGSAFLDFKKVRSSKLQKQISLSTNCQRFLVLVFFQYKLVPIETSSISIITGHNDSQFYQKKKKKTLQPLNNEDLLFSLSYVMCDKSSNLLYFGIL